MSNVRRDDRLITTASGLVAPARLQWAPKGADVQLDRSGWHLPELCARGLGVPTEYRSMCGIECHGCAQLRSQLGLSSVSVVDLGQQGVGFTEQGVCMSVASLFDGLHVEIKPLAHRGYRKPSIDVGLKVFMQLASEVHRAS